MILPDNPTGWFMSEKLDGCRCFWTGERFLSRNGNTFPAPDHWRQGMPHCRMDGELWMGRGTFPDLVSTIQRKGSDWQGVRFMAFDLADLHKPIETRLALLSRLTLPPHAALVPHRVCTGWNDLDSTEAETVAAGGEGLCIRPPQSNYRPGNFVKVKRLFPDLDRSTLD